MDRHSIQSDFPSGVEEVKPQNSALNAHVLFYNKISELYRILLREENNLMDLVKCSFYRLDHLVQTFVSGPLK